MQLLFEDRLLAIYLPADAESMALQTTWQSRCKTVVRFAPIFADRRTYPRREMLLITVLIRPPASGIVLWNSLRVSLTY
jgi:hypothetical protein